MEKEKLKRIFEFLEEKENHKVPFIVKVKFEIPFTKEELNVKHNLNLIFSKITSLPKGLKVGGDLYLQSSSIESLPKDLKVGGDLHLVHCEQLTSLPEGLEVEGYLNIRLMPLKEYTDKELRDMIKPGFIKGKIVR